MKIYLCARFSHAAAMRIFTKWIAIFCPNVEVVSRWHREDADHGWNGEDICRARKIVADDTSDIQAADALIYFNDTDDAKGSRGGRDWELGFAHHAGLLCLVVGRTQHVFCHAPGTVIVPDRQSLVEICNAWETRNERQHARGVAALLSTYNDPAADDMLKDPRGPVTLAPEASGTPEKVS